MTAYGVLLGACLLCFGAAAFLAGYSLAVRRYSREIRPRKNVLLNSTGTLRAANLSRGELKQGEFQNSKDTTKVRALLNSSRIAFYRSSLEPNYAVIYLLDCPLNDAVAFTL
jgi:hypothetical protein